MTATIDVSSLSKRFGRVQALDGVNLRVAAGTVHGFLGPNGAGKSTTIRCLLGLYRRYSGRVRVHGLDPLLDAAEICRQTSYVAGDVALWPTLRGDETLALLASLRGHRDAAKEQDLIERFSFDPSRRVRTYSKGNRQKLALIAAFAAPTKLLILDEPTTGLDPLMSELFLHLVLEAAGDGRAVLLSSHVLAEVDRVCDAVTMLRDGRVVEDAPLEELRARGDLNTQFLAHYGMEAL